MSLKDLFGKLTSRNPGEAGSLIGSAAVSPDLSTDEEKQLGDITTKLDHERQSRAGFGRFLKHPVRVLTERPENILIVCIPLALLVFFGGFILMVQTYGISVIFNSTSVDDFLMFAVLIAIVPVAILDLKEQMRITNLENALPN
ncbi:MAG TPA: type II secretion system F family protein, partial [Methanoregula sp.]|nr:type II secretion system F family protein [Methanoregula sp.]